MRTKVKPMWVVYEHGLAAGSFTTLHSALRHVGILIRGTTTGCMLVKAAEAVKAGFTIEQR